jgi:hypothetical protein
LLAQLVGVTLELVQHSQRSVERALRVVFMRDRRTKQSEDAVTRGLRDVAAVALHRLHHQLESRIDDCAGLLGVEVLYQVHRSLDVREQHSDRLALALDVFVG